MLLLVFTITYCGKAYHNMGIISANMKPTDQGDSDQGGLTDGAILVAAEAAIKDELKDPASAQFSDVEVHRPAGKTPLACGYVNAKNGFGGYMGAEAFISNGMPGITTMLSSQMRPREFRKAWAQICRF